MASSTARLLTKLEQARSRFVRGERVPVAEVLAGIGEPRFRDSASLIRFHDLLLFFRAFPQDPEVVRTTERLLSQCASNVAELRRRGVAMDAFEPENVCGIAGTAISDTFTYEVARWLAARYPTDLRIAWDLEEQAARLGASLPRFLPLLEEDALVEAGVPYLDWLRAAAGEPAGALPWLIERFQQLPLTDSERTEIYDALGVTLSWDLGGSDASRTELRWPARKLFFHEGPLIRRSEVSLARELFSEDLPVRRLPRAEAEALLDMVRAVVTVRYRELWGTTRGDPTTVVQASIGRGVEVFFWGLPPERRLPLRSYQAGITVKNGVPINYIEGIALFDWIEVGFNTFYAYRDGETAWIYARVLHFFRQLMGVSCVSVYPYQIGAGNDEAIQSGAFWFYRKLGFRSGDPELLALTEKEEQRIASRPGYRTPERTLRKFAGAHVFYELPGRPRGEWDRFSVRTLGLAVQRRMAAEFDGDAPAMRRAAGDAAAEILNVNVRDWSAAERTAFENFALVLALVPDLQLWHEEEKAALVRIIRAKAAPDETEYLRLLQRHPRLRQSLLELGSRRPAGNSGR